MTHYLLLLSSKGKKRNVEKSVDLLSGKRIVGPKYLHWKKLERQKVHVIECFMKENSVAPQGVSHFLQSLLISMIIPGFQMFYGEKIIKTWYCC